MTAMNHENLKTVKCSSSKVVVWW